MPDNAKPTNEVTRKTPAREILANGAAWMNGQIMPISEARLPVND